MDFQSILPAAFAGAWFSRESDKHSSRLWRIVPVDGKDGDLATLLVGLADVKHGRMFAVPGLERQTEDGQWVLVGALMSHQAKASDWVIVQQQKELNNDS